jgi:hypothetical protein
MSEKSPTAPQGKIKHFFTKYFMQGEHQKIIVKNIDYLLYRILSIT